MYSMGLMLLVALIFVIIAPSQAQLTSQAPLTTEQNKNETGVLASAGKTIIEQAAKSIADYIAKNLVQQSSFEVVIGRTVIISRNGNSVGIKDVSSGITISGHGSNPEEAMMDATTSFVKFLLQNNFISIDDLHLAPIRTTTPVPCGDLFPSFYCRSQKQIGNCYPNSAFYSFMKENCYGTCSGCKR